MTAVRSVLATYNVGIQLGLLRKSSSALRAAPQRNQMTLIWIVCTPGPTIHSFLSLSSSIQSPVSSSSFVLSLNVFASLVCSSSLYGPYLSRLCCTNLITRKLMLMKRMDMFFVGAESALIPGVTTMIMDCTAGHFSGSYPL
jgi:hypothetical protein